MIYKIDKLEEYIKLFPDLNPNLIEVALKESFNVYPKYFEVDLIDELGFNDDIKIDKAIEILTNLKNSGYNSVNFEFDKITGYKEISNEDIKNAIITKGKDLVQIRDLYCRNIDYNKSNIKRYEEKIKDIDKYLNIVRF